jgi:hypothetical protein
MEFRDSKLKMLGLIAGCLAFVIPLGILAGVDAQRGAYGNVVFELLGILFFGLGAVIVFWRMLVPKATPEMVIDGKGIKGWISKGYVPWSRIVFLWVKTNEPTPGASFFTRLIHRFWPERVIVCRYTPDKGRKFGAAKSAAQSAMETMAKTLTPDDEDYDDHDIDWIESTIRFRGLTPGIEAAISTIRSLQASKLVYEKPKDAPRT